MRTTKNAITPRPIKQLSRAVYTVTNPLGAAENALIGSVLNIGSGGHRANSSRSGSTAGRSSTLPATRPGEVFVGTGARASVGLASAERLATLMSVQRDRFGPATCPVVAKPARPDVAAMLNLARANTHLPSAFKRRQRRDALNVLAAQVAAAAHTEHEAALSSAAIEQSRADTWWTALLAGHPVTLLAALDAAFADNVARVHVLTASGSDAALMLELPDICVLGDKQPHVTPAGRLSSRNWPKADLHEAYAGLLGAHLLATIRETWAVAPSLTSVRIVGLRRSRAESKETEIVGLFEVMFAVDVGRSSDDWSADDCGSDVLRDYPRGLRRTGITNSVAPWPAKDLPLAITTATVGLKG